MLESQAIYSDSDNESNYREFEDSEDILFNQNIDYSVETFTVKIEENEKINDDSEEFISNKL